MISTYKQHHNLIIIETLYINQILYLIEHIHKHEQDQT